MTKKTEKITFRTTDENLKHLQDFQEKYDFPIGNTIHRMIQYFAKKGDVKNTFDELTK